MSDLGGNTPKPPQGPPNGGGRGAGGGGDGAPKPSSKDFKDDASGPPMGGKTGSSPGGMPPGPASGPASGHVPGSTGSPGSGGAQASPPGGAKPAGPTGGAKPGASKPDDKAAGGKDTAKPEGKGGKPGNNDDAGKAEKPRGEGAPQSGGDKERSKGEQAAREAGKQGARAAKGAADKYTGGATKLIPKKVVDKVGEGVGSLVYKLPQYGFGIVFLVVMGILAGGVVFGSDDTQMATAIPAVKDFDRLPQEQTAAYRKAVKAFSSSPTYGGEIPWGLLAAVAELASEHGKISPYLDDLCDRNPEQALQRGRVGISKDACPKDDEPSSFPVVSPAIGGDATKKQAAAGPFLLLPGVLAENKGVNAQSMDARDRFSTPRTATELIAREMDRIRKRMVDEEGRVAPQSGDAAGARQFWGEVLARLPIADPTAIGCKPASVGAGSDKDQVAVAVATSWRCELQQQELFVYEGATTEQRVEEGADAKVVAEALGVAWLFSKYGTNSPGCSVRTTTADNGTQTTTVTVTAGDAEPAGVFPLDKATFDKWADPTQIQLGRCDKGANITAAVRAFISVEGVEWEKREGDGAVKSLGGWSTMPWVLGDAATQQEFATRGAYRAFEPLGADKACADAVQTWGSAISQNRVVFTGLEKLTIVSETNPDANANGVADAFEAKGAELSAALAVGDPRGKGKPCGERTDGSVERFASAVAYERQVVKVNTDGSAGETSESIVEDSTGSSTTTTTLPKTVDTVPVADDTYTAEAQAADAVYRGISAYMEFLANSAPASSSLEVRPGVDSVVQRLSVSGRWGVSIEWPVVPASTYVSQALMFAQALTPLVADDPDHRADITAAELQTILDLLLPSTSASAAGGSIAGVPAILIDAVAKSVETGKQTPEFAKCTADTALLLAMTGTEAPGAWPSIQTDGTLAPRYVDPGVAERGDNDKGLLDGDPVDDHAVGIFGMTIGSMIGYKRWYPNVDPLNAATWSPSSYGYGSDGNGDGIVDPFNIYDEAYMSYKMFCRNAGERNLLVWGDDFMQALGVMVGGSKWNSEEPRDCYKHPEYPTWRACSEWLMKKKFDKAALYRAQLTASYISLGAMPPGIQRAIAWARGEAAMKRPYTGTLNYRFGQPWGVEPAPLKSTFPNSTATYWYPPGTISYDCSGFATRFWEEAGVNLKAMSATSSRTMKAVLPEVGLDMSQWRPGDLLIVDGYPGPDGDGTPDHVMVYIGNGQKIESSGGPGGFVRETSVSMQNPQYRVKWVVRPPTGPGGQ